MIDQERIEELQERIKELEEDYRDMINEANNLEKQVIALEHEIYDLKNKPITLSDVKDFLDKQIEDCFVYDKPVPIFDYGNKQVYITIL